MFRQLTPVVRALLITNVVVNVLQVLTLSGPMSGPLMALQLWPWHGQQRFGVPSLQPWQLLSYGFLHDPTNPLHLLANMLALYMFGPEVERLLGSRHFLTYYLVCVVGAALMQTFVTAVVYPSPYPTVGASGGIFGLLLLFGMAYPRRQVMLLFPPIPMPAWLFVTLYGLMELYLGVFHSEQGVAHFAHLGGMAAGYLLLQYWRWREPRPRFR
jgi:membrane associated rhomboid family serine protease